MCRSWAQNPIQGHCGHNCDPADCPVTTSGVPEPRAPALVRPPAAGGAGAAPQPHPEAGPGLAPRQAGGRPQTLLQVHHVQRQLVRSTGGKESSKVDIEEEFCLLLQMNNRRSCTYNHGGDPY